MATYLSDIRFFGTGSMSTPPNPGLGFELDDLTTPIGGAEDGGIVFEFTQPTSGQVQAVASAADTNTLTIAYLDPTNKLQTATITLNGTTVVPFSGLPGGSIQGLLRCFYADALTNHADDIALEDQTAVRTGTAQAGGGNPTPSITLDAGASAVDDFYTGMLCRITGGTGSGQIVKITKYVGSSKIAYIDGGYTRVWPSATPNNTSVFRIAPGIALKGYTNARECRVPFYNALANPSSQGVYFEKIFIENGGQTNITSATLALVDSSGFLTFAFETVQNGVGTNGTGNNRRVAPTTNVGTFATGTQNWPYNGQQFATGDDDGVWLKLTIPAGAATKIVSFQLQVGGSGFTTPPTAPPAPVDTLWFEEVGQAVVPKDNLPPLTHTWNVLKKFVSSILHFWRIGQRGYSSSITHSWNIREAIFQSKLTHTWRVIPNLPALFASDIHQPTANLKKSP